MGRVISVAMTFKDAFTGKSKKALESIEKMSRNVKKAGKSVQNAGKTIESAGSSMTKAITLPVAGMGVAAVKTAADFEAGMSNVGAIMGTVSKKDIPDAIKAANDMHLSFKKGGNATETAMNIMEAQAKNLGATTAWSAQKVSQAMQYTGMAGWKAADNVRGLKGILDLASASGTDLARTSDIMTDAISAFGDTANDSKRYADVMTSACTSANVSVDTLGESYKYCGAVAGTMKYSVEDVTTSLAAMGNQGIKGSAAGTAMRTAMTNLAAPSDAASKAMKKLGISITDQHGKMKSWKDVVKNCQEGFSGLSKDQQAAYAKTIFGKSAMSGMLAVLNTSEKDYKKLGNTIKNSGGAADKASKTQLNNLKGQITLLKSAVEGAEIAFGNKMLPTLKKITSFAQKVVDKINGLSDAQVEMAIKIAGTAAAVGPAILIFGKMVSGVGGAIIKFSSFLNMIKKFGGIVGILTSPGAVVIGVLAAIAVAAFLIIKNWSKIKPVVDNVVKAFKQGVDNIKPAVDSVMKTVKKAMPPIKKAIQQALKASTPIIKQAIKLLKQIAQIIKGVVSKAVKAVMPVVRKLGECFKAVFPVIAKLVATKIGDIAGTIKQLQPVFTVAFSVISSIAKNLAKTFSKCFSGIMKVLGGIIDFITGVFSGNWKKAWQGVKDIFSGIFSTFATIAKAPINGVISVVNGAIKGFNKIKIPDWVPGVGGKGINIPTIPTLAKGTRNWKGGIVQISERGGEIVDLPQGSRVYPHDESIKKAKKDGLNAAKSKANINVTINISKMEVRNDEDIEKFADLFAKKVEKVAANMA